MHCAHAQDVNMAANRTLHGTCFRGMMIPGSLLILRTLLVTHSLLSQVRLLEEEQTRGRSCLQRLAKFACDSAVC